MKECERRDDFEAMKSTTDNNPCPDYKPKGENDSTCRHYRRLNGGDPIHWCDQEWPKWEP